MRRIPLVRLFRRSRVCDFRDRLPAACDGAFPDGMRRRSTDDVVGQRDLQDGGHGTRTTKMKQTRGRLGSVAELDFISHGEKR